MGDRSAHIRCNVSHRRRSRGYGAITTTLCGTSAPRSSTVIACRRSRSICSRFRQSAPSRRFHRDSGRRDCLCQSRWHLDWYGACCWAMVSRSPGAMREPPLVISPAAERTRFRHRMATKHNALERRHTLHRGRATANFTPLCFGGRYDRSSKSWKPQQKIVNKEAVQSHVL